MCSGKVAKKYISSTILTFHKQQYISVTECKIDEGWPIRSPADITRCRTGAASPATKVRPSLSQTENQREMRFGLTKIIHSEVVKLLHA